jgi:hypothetical protein
VEAFERVGADQVDRIDIAEARKSGDFRSGPHALPKPIRNDQSLAYFRPRRQLRAGFRINDYFERSHFIKAIGNFWTEANGAVARDRPWRRRPDDDTCASVRQLFP